MRSKSSEAFGAGAWRKTVSKSCSVWFILPHHCGIPGRVWFGELLLEKPQCPALTVFNCACCHLHGISRFLQGKTLVIVQMNRLSQLRFQAVDQRVKSGGKIAAGYNLVGLRIARRTSRPPVLRPRLGGLFRPSPIDVDVVSNPVHPRRKRRFACETRQGLPQSPKSPLGEISGIRVIA